MGAPGSLVHVSTLPRVPTERDAFDTLFDHAPDKLNVVKKVRQKLGSSKPGLHPKGPSLPGAPLRVPGGDQSHRPCVSALTPTPLLRLYSPSP